MLDSVFAEVGQSDTRFTIHAPAESDIPSWFKTYTVPVVHKTLLENGPDPFLSIESAGEFVGAISLKELEALLTPPIKRPPEETMVSDGYRVLFEALDATVFTALGRTQLLAVSREIEDRAYRVGNGTLRVCFQTFSTFNSQLSVYRHLATDTELDIHIYAVADWDPPAIEGITYHDISGMDLERYWLLAFDGGTEPTNACGLFSRETDESYTGYWTDDRTLINRIATELQTNVDDSPVSAD